MMAWLFGWSLATVLLSGLAAFGFCVAFGAVLIYGYRLLRWAARRILGRLFAASVIRRSREPRGETSNAP